MSRVTWEKGDTVADVFSITSNDLFYSRAAVISIHVQPDETM